MKTSNYVVEFKFYYSDMSVTLPVPPKSFILSKVSGVEVIENVAGETKSRPTSSGLYRYSIQSILPSVDESSTNRIFLPNNVVHLYRGMGDGAPVCYPHDYKRFFTTVQNELGTMRVVIVGLLGIEEMQMHVERFEYGYKAGTKDVEYTLDVVQSKPMTISTLVKKPTAVSPPVTNNNGKNFAMGSRVELTGRYFYDSYGSSPSYVFKNGFVGQVHKIMSNSRPYPIHITLTRGTSKPNWVGWVKRNQIVRVL